MGWLGDAQLVVEESIFNFDMAAFYTKWLRDIRNRRRRRQCFRCGAPLLAALSCRPAMGTACVVIPWNLYLYYDDERILEENYRLVKGWVDYLTSINVGHLIKFSKYGDWCPPNKFRSLDTPGELISSWCYNYDALTLSKIAGVLGKSNDAEKYAKLSQETKEAFNGSFWKRITTLIILKLLIACCISIFAPSTIKKAIVKECYIRKLPTFYRFTWR